MGRVRNVEVYECPGGEFVPEGALVIEKVEGEWPEAIRATILDYLVLWTNGDKWQDYVSVELLDALASQVGESE